MREFLDEAGICRGGQSKADRPPPAWGGEGLMQFLKGLMGQKEEESWICSLCLAVKLGHQTAHILDRHLHHWLAQGSSVADLGLLPAA